MKAVVTVPENKSLRRGVFPGSFNPLTVAHLEIARSALDVADLDEVHLVMSEVALDKPTPPGPPFAERVEILIADCSEFPWLSVATTTAQLIVDIARGYDAVIMGGDKWEQVNDPAYYGSTDKRDAALRDLPEVFVAERDGSIIEGAQILETDPSIRHISSTVARDGKRDLMAPHARKRWRQKGD